MDEIVFFSMVSLCRGEANIPGAPGHPKSQYPEEGEAVSPSVERGSPLPISVGITLTSVASSTGPPHTLIGHLPTHPG